MSELQDDRDLMQLCRAAFLDDAESDDPLTNAVVALGLLADGDAPTTQSQDAQQQASHSSSHIPSQHGLPANNAKQTCQNSQGLERQHSPLQTFVHAPDNPVVSNHHHQHSVSKHHSGLQDHDMRAQAGGHVPGNVGDAASHRLPTTNFAQHRDEQRYACNSLTTCSTSLQLNPIKIGSSATCKERAAKQTPAPPSVQRVSESAADQKMSAAELYQFVHMLFVCHMQVLGHDIDVVRQNMAQEFERWRTDGPDFDQLSLLELQAVSELPPYLQVPHYCTFDSLMLLYSCVHRDIACQCRLM